MLYTFYDVETSGLEVGCDVLSFSYMLADESLNVKRAETLYFWKEGVTQWTQGAYEVHGLSKEFLRKYADQYETNLRKMYIVLSYGDLVGYNSGHLNAEGVVQGYDFPVCKSFLLRNGMYEPSVLGFYDVMLMCKQVHHRRWKLQKEFDVHGLSRDLAQAFMNVYFGVDGKAHESAYDVVCTAMLFQWFHDEGYVQSGQKPVVNYLEDVEERTDGYTILFEESGMVIKDDYDDTRMPASEFSQKYPKLFEVMMENPSAYM